MQVIANLAATTSRRARLGGEQTSRQRAGPDHHNLNLAQDAQGGKMTLKELNPDGRKTSSTCHRVWRALRLIHGVRDIFHFVAERGTFQKISPHAESSIPDRSCRHTHCLCFAAAICNRLKIKRVVRRPTPKAIANDKDLP
ncbi:MAG: hypothetical protein JO300_05670 [Silvibacterium sp.]|nr:hypothetical protein [Silvibacterium sp.]